MVKYIEVPSHQIIMLFGWPLGGQGFLTRGFQGSDSEWHEEFNLLRQECITAAVEILDREESCGEI